MTRILAEILGVRSALLSNQIRKLEQFSGSPSHDIRLTSEIILKTKEKIRELGLDHSDTTGAELYEALKLRLVNDNIRLHESMGLLEDASSRDILAGLEQFYKRLDIPQSCFALKQSVAKRLLKALQPKKTMKLLGYRSIDSMLKHEPVFQLFMAAKFYESQSWQRQLNDSYAKLTPSDFESRSVIYYYPQSKRWERLGLDFSNATRRTVKVLPEFGAIIVLPIDITVPALALTNLLLILDGVNTIRCASAYLKLRQVSSSFTESIIQVSEGDFSTKGTFAGNKLPWHIIQKFYYKLAPFYFPVVFEPHVQPEDLELVNAEKAIAKEIPALEFWENTNDLIMLNNHEAVSLNMTDIAISVANQVSFDERFMHNAREQIWNDFIMKYLHSENLEKVLQQLTINEQTDMALEGIDI